MSQNHDDYGWESLIINDFDRGAIILVIMPSCQHFLAKDYDLHNLQDLVGILFIIQHPGLVVEDEVEFFSGVILCMSMMFKGLKIENCDIFAFQHSKVPTLCQEDKVHFPQNNS